MSFGVKLPITYSSIDGFTELKTFRSTLKQNFKMLLLTNPGERVMEPNFGVGVKTYLFANYGDGIQGRLRSKIIDQVATYMPVISIDKVSFDTSNMENNALTMAIFYSIPSIGIKDLLEFTI